MPLVPQTAAGASKALSLCFGVPAFSLRSWSYFVYLCFIVSFCHISLPRAARTFFYMFTFYTSTHKCVFFTLRHLFLFRPRSFLVLSAPWHTESPPGPNSQVWAPAEVRGSCSGGSKSPVTKERHSKHVEPSRPMQTHVQAEKMSNGSCDI